VATTSGTAAVELHPAVVEASHAGVPLIAVTADRPPELHGVGAPQTVDQDGLFGTSPRWAVSPGVAEQDAQNSWRSLAARLVAESVAGPNGPGPVHLNLAFREPLLGTPAEAVTSAGRPDGGPWHERMPSKGAQPHPSLIDLLAGQAGGRGLIVAGAGAGEPATLTAVANRLGWPLMAEPRSGCRVSDPSVVACADALLRIPEVAAWRPDVVLRLGAPWVSKVLTQWLAGLGPQTTQVLVDPWGRWADPDRQVRHVVASDPTVVMEALLAATGDPRPPAVSEAAAPAFSGAPAGVAPAGSGASAGSGAAAGSSWAKQWLVAERRAQAVLDTELGAAGPLAMSEPGVARAVLAGVPDGAQVVVSSSMPIRDVEWYSAPRDGVAVLSNRGTNGIDGVLSTAIGAALGTGAPTVALVGDMAFLYDAGALLGSAGRNVALTIVVIDNNGGGIFSFLPQAATLPAGQFERYWGTPHGVDIATVAAAYGVEVKRLDGRSALEGVLADAARPGVRVAVVRTDRQRNVVDHERLHRAIGDAVRGP
jgi:2-succinyl-5-enolpyruvyl-6-hydroxy-3-cyclohexene-1-carboxylate synthase